MSDAFSEKLRPGAYSPFIRNHSLRYWIAQLGFGAFLSIDFPPEIPLAKSGSCIWFKGKQTSFKQIFLVAFSKIQNSFSTMVVLLSQTAGWGLL